MHRADVHVQDLYCVFTFSISRAAPSDYHHPEGQLRHKETNKPFVFMVKKEDKRYNQAHYEALGEVPLNYSYALKGLKMPFCILFCSFCS